MADTLRLRYPFREARVGRIIVSVTIGSFFEPGKEIRCDALVDTGAYCLTVPASWKERLGPLPLSRPVRLETADQRVLEGEICGPLEIRIAKLPPLSGEVLFLPVEPGTEDFEPLLGYVTLEQAGLVVDMIGHRLVKLPHLDLKRVA